MSNRQGKYFKCDIRSCEIPNGRKWKEESTGKIVGNYIDGKWVNAEANSNLREIYNGK